MDSPHPLIAVPVALLAGGTILIVLMRYGLLATVLFGTVGQIAQGCFNFGIPGMMWLGAALVMLLGIHGLHSGLAGRPLFRGAFLEE